MACRDFRTIAAEERLRKAAGMDDTTLAQRLVSLRKRMQACDTSDDHLSEGERVLRDAVGAEGRD